MNITQTPRSSETPARRPLNNWVGVIGRGWPWPGLGFCGLVGLVGCRFGRPWCRPWGGPAPGPCWAGASGGGQCPGAVAAGEAAADEVAQVEGGGAALQPGVVGGHTQVAQLQAAAATAGKLGDDAFHVRPVAPVVIPVMLIGRAWPVGQVTVPARSSTVKSSTVNPPTTAACSGLGLITAVCPAPAMASRRSPVP